MTKHHTLIEAAETVPGVQDHESKVVDLAMHRSAADDRFPHVDDIVDRLTMDMQLMVRTVGGADISF